MSLRLAIVGLGKIARDQHLPSISRMPGIALAAIASPHSRQPGVANFASLADLLASDVKVDAVALCTPPQGRQAQAAAALHAGLHVLLEKPPGTTVSEIAPLVSLARQKGLSLFATWHSRFAAAVAPAKAFLADRDIRAVGVDWKEDVRKWHPGQQWIWEPGGLGVFDPGINALSIVTQILPQPMFLDRSDLYFPTNRAAPIAASLRFSDARATPIMVEFDWRQLGPQIWHIHVETDHGRLTIDQGGKRLLHGENLLAEGADGEYDAIYRRFAELIATGQSDVDLSPLAHVADAFLLGRRHEVEPFHDLAM